MKNPDQRSVTEDERRSLRHHIIHVAVFIGFIILNGLWEAVTALWEAGKGGG